MPGPLGPHGPPVTPSIGLPLWPHGAVGPLSLEPKRHVGFPQNPTLLNAVSSSLGQGKCRSECTGHAGQGLEKGGMGEGSLPSMDDGSGLLSPTTFLWEALSKSLPLWASVS